MVPVVAPAGIVTCNEVVVVAAKLVTPVAPVKVTVLVAPAVKFVPGIVIVDPTHAAAGIVPTVGNVGVYSSAPMSGVVAFLVIPS
jgi:hypothetical protein